jgi:hypothetical protein
MVGDAAGKGTPALSEAEPLTGGACADPKQLGRSRSLNHAAYCNSGNKSRGTEKH